MATAKWITPASLAVTTGICTLLIGVSLIATGINPSRRSPESDKAAEVTLSSLLPLAPTQRGIPLEALAQLGAPTGNRARYLLASDRIQQRQGKAALTWLEGLEQDYPVLAPEILSKRAQAYALAGSPVQAKATWQELLQRYPDQPATAEALYALGQTQPQYWNRAIVQFPAHPRTVEIVQARLQQNPKQPRLLLLLARHALYLPGISAVLDSLVSQYKDQLQPEDWQAIAFGYWSKQDYGKAAAAYAKSPLTARNAYRAARGLQLEGKDKEAVKAYERLIARFPQAPETPKALIKLASLVPTTQALQHLDRATQTSQRPQLGEALLAKFNLLDNRHSVKAALQTRQRLLTTYRDTDAAAELLWAEAQRHAEAQQYTYALQLAQQIAQHNPDSELAPQATFWAGKWSSQLGHQAQGRAAFQRVLSSYPESYYAWRSAVRLGWDVGDFTSVRQVSPPMNQPEERLRLPAGSPALQELYLLHQDRDAWVRWQWEHQNRMAPTPEEQLTDGLLRLGVGDNLEGLFMLSDLQRRSREEPETQPQYQALQQKLGYWQALYPLAFVDPITHWSQQRNLNPLLVIALIRQESRFQPAIRSSAGATGLMQVMPATASWIAEQTKLNHYQLQSPVDNIKLGTWYLDYTHDSYNNNSLLAVASYNAGPGNVAEWVKKGLRDPDVFVEAIPFPETKGYVKAVFKNYWNYQRLYNPEVSQLLRKRA